MNQKPSANFRDLFWFLPKSKTAMADRNLVVHQVLAYGNMDDVRSLFKKFGRKVVTAEFKKPRPGLYQPAILNFFQQILKIKHLDKNRYLKNLK